MLKQKLLTAVAKAKEAVQDLAITVVHISKGPATFVPGSAPTYLESVSTVKAVVTRFKAIEIDDDRIQSSDYLALVFHEVDLPSFKANDLIRMPSGLQDVLVGDYRIINDDKILAGDTVVLHQLQLRKL